MTVLSSFAFCNSNLKKEIFKYANEFYTNPEETQIEAFNEESEMKKLLHEITSEKRFLPEIKPSTFVNNYFVLPTLDNERITRQSGGFIISALNKEKGTDINSSRVKIKGKKVIYVIPNEKKEDLRKELENFGIDSAFIYPEISEVAKYLKRKYLN